MSYTRVTGPDGTPRTDVVSRDSDGAFVATSTSCPFWMADDAQAYQAWIAAGGTPAPAPASVATACVTGRQIVAQAKVAGVSASLVAYLRSPQAASAVPTSILYWQAISLDTRVPIDNAKVANILTGAGVPDVPAFMAAALLLAT